MEKEKTNAFFSTNTIFGLFVGLSYIATAYIFHTTGRGINFNPRLGNVILLLSIIGAYIGAKKYRNEQLHGIITYGRALGTCTYIISVAAVAYGLFLYYLYRHTPGLQENYVTMTTTVLEEVYKGSPLLATMQDMVKTLMTPGVIAFAEIFSKIVTGFIFSLFLAGIIRRRQQTI